MKIGNQAINQWQHYVLNKLWREPIRVGIAMSCCAVFAWYHHQIIWTIPLILGVVAAALTDIDDRFTGRLKNIVITLGCFAIASISTELLFPYPILFCIGLAISSWVYILLGALGQRYATIAFGALLLAIYTMLGVGLFPTWYSQPILLLIGACVYYLLTLVSHIIFPVRPVEEQLINTYSALADYLEAKATLFDPDDAEENRRQFYKISVTNSRLVQQLNVTKTTIQSRLRGTRASNSSRRTLLYYFVAQEIHERANSSHINYQQLKKQWQFNELMFRLERLLRRQATACRAVATSIQSRDAYRHQENFAAALNHAEQALERVSFQADKEICERLRWLIKNLKAIDQQLSSISSEQDLNTIWQSSDIELSIEGLQGWLDIKSRIIKNLTPKSGLFRHAVRVSIVLCVGYLLIQLTGLHRGYWILLTSLFVCQPNYSATKRRLALRIVGTVLGIILGLPLLWLIPSIQGQLIGIVVFGVLFFIFRQIQYAQATLFITLMVLFCFNLLGEGFNVALPRILDTLIGCGLAWIAVSYIFPDWRYRQLPSVINKAYSANLNYLAAVIQQYQDGKDNRVSYRIARREAHNADADLASVITLAENEVWPSLEMKEASFEILCSNHSFLSYIAALGAHRQKLEGEQLLAMLNNLLSLAKNYEHASLDSSDLEEKFLQLGSKIDEIKIDDGSQKTLIVQQVALLSKVLVELLKFRLQLLKP